jgi:hypothetical protein
MSSQGSSGGSRSGGGSGGGSNSGSTTKDITVYLPTPAARSGVLEEHPGARFRGSSLDHYLDAHGRLHTRKPETKRRDKGAVHRSHDVDKGGCDEHVDCEDDRDVDSDVAGDGDGGLRRDRNQDIAPGRQNSAAKYSGDTGSVAVTTDLGTSLEQNGSETARRPVEVNVCSRKQVVEANGVDELPKQGPSVSSHDRRRTSCSADNGSKCALRMESVPSSVQPKKAWKWGTSQLETQEKD